MNQAATAPKTCVWHAGSNDVVYIHMQKERERKREQQEKIDPFEVRTRQYSLVVLC